MKKLSNEEYNSLMNRLEGFACCYAKEIVPDDKVEEYEEAFFKNNNYDLEVLEKEFEGKKYLRVRKGHSFLDIDFDENGNLKDTCTYRTDIYLYDWTRISTEVNYKSMLSGSYEGEVIPLSIYEPYDKEERVIDSEYMEYAFINRYNVYKARMNMQDGKCIINYGNSGYTDKWNTYGGEAGYGSDSYEDMSIKTKVLESELLENPYDISKLSTKSNTRK